MSDFEDTAINQAIELLGRAGKADFNRLMVLRAGSDFNFQPNGQTPAQYLAEENNFELSGFARSIVSSLMRLPGSA